MLRVRAANEKPWIALLVALVAALFWGPAIPRTGGAFPAPLDDVYIHFDYARALAEGSPFAWISGQGYSSGETAPLYAWVLAAAYFVGFRGMALGYFAGALACGAVYSGLVAGSRLLRELPTLARVSGLLLLAAGSVAPFLFFSGMEGALHFACMMHALRIYDALTRDGALGRPRTMPRGRAALTRRLAWLSAAMFLLRPESLVLTWLFAVGVARAYRGPRPFVVALRVAMPAALALLVVSSLNLAFTGYVAAAGAKLKLLTSNPYLGNVDRAREVAMNLFFFGERVLGAELSVLAGAAKVLFLLALVGVGAKRARSVGVVCLLGAAAFALLVSLNGAARYQNFRYYVPALVLVTTSALLGAASLSRVRALRVPVALGLVALAFSSLPRTWAQSVYFARCAANIHDLQVEAGARIARELPEDAIILVGDAGAVPYVSRRHAVDALGLGGYHGVPFVIAATQGEAATLELLERLPEASRPSHMALFPNWFPEITSRFGVPLFSVTVADNAIAGGPTKTVYRADFATLAPYGEARAPRALDEVDVADVVSERAHAYVSPAPRGGWTTVAVRDDGAHGARFDGGRIIPAGERESFVVHTPGTHALMARWDLDSPRPEDAPRVDVDGEPADVVLDAKAPAAIRTEFSGARIELRGVRVNARVTVRATGAGFRSYHYWLE